MVNFSGVGAAAPFWGSAISTTNMPPFMLSLALLFDYILVIFGSDFQFVGFAVM